MSTVMPGSPGCTLLPPPPQPTAKSKTANNKTARHFEPWTSPPCFSKNAKRKWGTPTEERSATESSFQRRKITKYQLETKFDRRIARGGMTLWLESLAQFAKGSKRFSSQKCGDRAIFSKKTCRRFLTFRSSFINTAAVILSSHLRSFARQQANQ